MARTAITEPAVPPPPPPIDQQVQRSVMTKIGYVPDLLRVDIKRIYGDSYRINVYVSGDRSEAGVIQTSKIHSSFVHTQTIITLD